MIHRIKKSTESCKRQWNNNEMTFEERKKAATHAHELKNLFIIHLITVCKLAWKFMRLSVWKAWGSSIMYQGCCLSREFRHKHTIKTFFQLKDSLLIGSKKHEKWFFVCWSSHIFVVFSASLCWFGDCGNQNNPSIILFNNYFSLLFPYENIN